MIDEFIRCNDEVIKMNYSGKACEDWLTKTSTDESDFPDYYGCLYLTLNQKPTTGGRIVEENGFKRVVLLDLETSFYL